MEDLESFRRYFDFLKECCLVTELESEEITSVSHFEESVPDEEDGAAVFSVGRKWYTITENQDYTGHG